MDQNLVDLLKKKQTTSGSAMSVDWDERRDKYLDAVRQLYEQIAVIFAEPIAQKSVMLHRRAKQLTENLIGTYSVDDLVLAIGDEQVRFSPRGRNVVGAVGRVDVIGERGEAMLVVQDDSQWGIVQSRQPTLKVESFNESTLSEVLRLVMRD